MPPIFPENPSGSSHHAAASGATLDDYRWLVSGDAQHWLDIAGEAEEKSLVKVSLAFRKSLTTQRTLLVVAQTELRHRAAIKFRAASRMFFTRLLLEQATDEQIAGYKASRVPANGELADLCCGIGGDLMGLAGRGTVTGVDLDPVAVVLAEANCRVTGRESVAFRVADACGVPVEGFSAWHLDPDRRPQGKRTTLIELHEPGLEAIDRLVARHSRAAVKLAPAAQVPEHWARNAELEWIGNRGECRQQMVWFGDLARYPGRRVATVFLPGSDVPRTLVGEPQQDLPVAESVARYVFEPHAAVLAADLTGIVAAEHRLPCVSPGIPYLTGDGLVSDPALACFELIEVLPLDPKYLRTAIRERNIGTLEVKKRGVKVDPDEVRRQVHPRGDESATLIITPVNKRVRVLLTKRVKTDGDAA